MKTGTFKRELTRWLVLHRIGKLPTTRHYHREIIHSIRRAAGPLLNKPTADLTAGDVEAVALRLGHYSPSRWNGCMTVLRATIPDELISPGSLTGRLLKRRKVRSNRKPPPNQQQFSALLAECDKLAKSRAGLVVNFLGHTGLRITAAKNVRWSDVYEDRIEYTAKGGRRCSVPIINGLRDVLERLRALDDGSGYVLPCGSIRTGLAKACAKAGIRTLTHHDFRHMFTTRCLEQGVDIGTVARWRGDSDRGAMLLKNYFHLLDAHSRVMAAKVRI